MESYYVVRKDIASTFTVEDDVEECIERMDYSLATGNRLLYSEVTDAMDASEQMELMSDSAFSLFKKYMDYQIFDKEGNPLLEGNDDQTNEALKSDNSYVLKIEYKYGTSGTMSNVTVSGTKLSPEEAYDVEKDLSYYCMDADLEDQIDDEEQTDGISIVYGMTDANYDEFISANQEEDEYVDYNYSMFWSSAALFFLGALLAALLLPCIPKVGRYEGKLFRMPFELAVILGISALGIGYDAFAGLVYWSFENYHPSGNIMWNTISMLGINWCIWFCLLGVFFCVAESLRLIFTEGRNYWEEHTIVGMLIRWGKENRGEVHEKRKEYTEVLERKSLRLKALIEDLFEMSKAASKTIQMNYMKVDLVGLIRQAELENEEKIREAHLEFRWKLPEDKVVLWLDSEKTYRIFENLIVNITKYAMPHTRVYIEMNERPDDVQIFMKNVSAGELNFNTEEITDRFVRGDSSRNTEGSGLGLAIAKSFAQLQHGNLKITTEADLFKAEIILPKLEMSEKKED